MYQKNRDVFAKRYASVLTHIEKLDVSRYHVVPSESGSPYLHVEKERGGVIHLGDPVDPVAEARASLPDLRRGNQSLFVVMGLGLGHLLLEAVKKYPRARYIVVEQDGRVFRRAMESLDLRQVFEMPNVSFAVSLSESILARYFMGQFSEKDMHLYLPTITPLQNPKITRHGKKYYERVALCLKEAMQDFWFGCVGNDCLDSLTGLDHTLKNFKHHDRFMDVEPMKDLFKGRVGVVVSSGPSLDNRIAMLKSIQDRVVLISADTALKKLITNGIVPFGVTSIERNFSADKLFRGVDLPPNLILFATPFIKPDIIRDYSGHVCFMGKNGYPFGWLPKLTPIWEMGHSCSHLATRVLDHLGCRVIALVGQDLAYHPETGASHFGEVMDFVKSGYGDREKMTVESNHGGSIQTTPVWAMFLNEFNNLASLFLKASLINVIEPEFGAKIASAERMDPERFMTLMHEEPRGVSETDPDAFFRLFREKWNGFYPNLKTACENSICQLKQLGQGLGNLATASRFDEYRKRRDGLMQTLDERTQYLFDDLVKPSIRPFEARSFALSSTDEFRRELPGFVSEIQTMHGNLLKVLEENYHDLFF